MAVWMSVLLLLACCAALVGVVRAQSCVLDAFDAVSRNDWLQTATVPYIGTHPSLTLCNTFDEEDFFRVWCGAAARASGRCVLFPCKLFFREFFFFDFFGFE